MRQWKSLPQQQHYTIPRSRQQTVRYYLIWPLTLLLATVSVLPYLYPVVRQDPHKQGAKSDEALWKEPDNNKNENNNNNKDYPVVNRTSVLSEIALCGAGRLPKSWKEDNNKQFVTSLEPNHPCPTAQLLDDVPNNDEEDDRVTLFVIYYEDLNLLAAQVDSWLRWPEHVRRRFTFLIVDDGSRVGRRAMDLIWPHRSLLLPQIDLRVVEVEQDLSWNIGGARNLAFQVAPTSHLVLSDCDILIHAETAQYILQLQKNETIYYQFDRIRVDGVTHKPHPAIMLSSKRAYWASGGCDEDFVGHYGHTDVHFFWRAKKSVQLSSQENEMKQKQIPPLQELSSDQTCPAWAESTCQKASANNSKRKRTKTTAPNKVVFQDKTKGKRAWSNEYLRFRWHQVKLNS